jgi:Tfp pilus assembly PilM family ATPase
VSLPKNIVTLDIDETAIKMLEIRGGVVRKWASVLLGPNEITVDDEEGSEWEALSAMVRQLMASSGMRVTRAYASVSGLYSVNRIVVVTNPPPAGLTYEQALIEEVREAVPLSEERLYIQWQPVATYENKERVLVTGVPKDLIDNEVLSLKAAGIKPQLLELRTMALVRAVNRELAIILNIEISSFDIVVVVNGIPEIMRTVAWHYEDLTLEDKVQNLTTTLDMTVDFYNLRHPDANLTPATPLFITGQLSGDLALEEELEASMQYSVEPLAPPLECPAHLPVSQYAVNIGLALKGMTSPKAKGDEKKEEEEEGEQEGGNEVIVSPPQLHIDLLPEAYRPWKPTPKQMGAFGFIILALIGLLPVYQVATDAVSRTADLQVRQDILNSELQRRQIEINNRRPLQQAINEHNLIVEMGGDFTGDIDFIRDEARKLDILVDTISHDGEKIVISCEADDYLTFRTYETALRDSGRFASIVAPSERYEYITGGTIEVVPQAIE